MNAFETNLHTDKFNIVVRNNDDIGAYLVNYEENHLWLEMLLIAPSTQDHGIGTWVKHKIQNESKNADKPLKLSMLKVNPVKAFYLGLGFSVYEEDESSYKMKWTYNKRFSLDTAKRRDAN